MHQPRNDPEQRTLRGAKAQAGPDHVGVGLLALQIVEIEMVLQMRVTVRVPAFVDTVDDSRQLPFRCALAHQAVQAGTLGLGGDLRRIGRADGRDMAGIEAARFQERNPPVEFDPIDVEGGVGNRQCLALAGVEIALIGDVVDGQHGRHVGAVPAHIGRCQASRPIVDMDDVRYPAQSGAARGDIGRRQRQPGEPEVVVLPVRSLGGAVRRATPVE